MSRMSELDQELNEALDPHLKAIANAIEAIAERTGLSAFAILDYVNIEDEVHNRILNIHNHTDEP